MKKQILIKSTIILSLFMLIWSGCKKDSSPEIETFIIHIDSIIHADTINFGDNLIIKFYGKIGPDGCYSFNEIAPEYITGTLSVTCWGKHTYESVCTQDTVYMVGKTLQVSEMPVGKTIIEAIQPDGTSISQSVYVKE